MNFAFFNPRVWLRNSIQAAPKFKQSWRDWLNAPSLAEVVEKQGDMIYQLRVDVVHLEAQARNLYRALDEQMSVTVPPPMIAPPSLTSNLQ